MTIATLLEIANEIAPFETAEEWDNVGLLLGRMDWTVRGIHVALDATLGEIEKMGNANVLLTHHPLLFQPVQRIDYSMPEQEVIAACIRKDIALIALHTNWDKAPGGVSDTLAEVLALQNVEAADDFLRIGDLPSAMAAQDFIAYVNTRIGCKAYCGYDFSKSKMRRIAVAPGGGGGECYLAAQKGADAFISGEIKHNQLLDCHALGIVALACGHYETEQPSIPVLARSLQKRLDGLQYNVEISVGKGFAGGIASQAI